MVESSRTDIEIDELDHSILQALQVNGRISNADLARQINLSPPAVHARMKRLEQQGIIQKYVALLDRERVGYDMLCFINVSMAMHQREHIDHFRLLVQDMPEVLECHHLTGEYDYLLKVVVRGRRDLEQFVVDRLAPIPGMARIHTSLVLAEVKVTTAVPLIPNP